MKLYKKNIWVVLAMGLLVCAPSDAGVVERKQEERCAGVIIEAARNADAKGTVAMAEIKADGRQCTYTGSVPGVPTSISYAFKERKDKLDQYQEYVTENDECDPEETVCLIDTGEDMKKAQNKKKAGAATAGAAVGAGAAAAGATVGAGVGSLAGVAGATATAAATGAAIAVAAPLIAVAAPIVATRGAQNIQCKKTCEGYFVNSANKNGMKVLIDPSDIQHMIEGVGRNRKCLCKYIGPENGFSVNATFLQRESRQDKKTEELKSYSEQAKDSENCKLSEETCLGNIPKKLDEKDQCILAFWQYGKDNGLRGTITEINSPVKAEKKQDTNEIKCTYDGSIPAMPTSLTIKADPDNINNRTTYATQMHLGNKVCQGPQSICLFKGQR